MAQRQGNIVFEPCTLVYTLIDDNSINFDDFALIVRSLHTYMVESITPNKDMHNVHVKLNYQASVANAISKLGFLQDAIAVTKLSSFVDESEFSRLDNLRRRFGIGMPESTQTGIPQPIFGGHPRASVVKASGYAQPNRRAARRHTPYQRRAQQPFEFPTVPNQPAEPSITEVNSQGESVDIYSPINPEN